MKRTALLRTLPEMGRFLHRHSVTRQTKGACVTIHRFPSLALPLIRKIFVPISQQTRQQRNTRTRTQNGLLEAQHYCQ